MWTHNGPVQPGGQLHWPETWWQMPLFLQRHSSAQSWPKCPGAKVSQDSSHLGPVQPGAHWQRPSYGSHVELLAHSHCMLHFWPHSPGSHSAHIFHTGQLDIQLCNHKNICWSWKQSIPFTFFYSFPLTRDGLTVSMK